MKKKLLLKKETLIRLHEKQMMILGGIGEMSNSQYFDNKVAVNVSCCKRSCLKPVSYTHLDVYKRQPLLSFYMFIFYIKKTLEQNMISQKLFNNSRRLCIPILSDA